MRGLAGKRIVITGASRGLGRQLALAFARTGVEHIAITARDSAMLEKTAEEARTAAPRTRILAVAADLGRPDEVERVAAGVLDEFKGRVDALNHPRLKSGGSRSSAKADWGRHHGSTLKSASWSRSGSCWFSM